MNQSLLNEGLLQKDIEQLAYYTDEENEVLKKISSVLRDVSNSYQSPNTASFLNHTTHWQQKIRPIYEKRKQYEITLNRVIEQYNRLTNETIQKFNQDV